MWHQIQIQIQCFQIQIPLVASGASRSRSRSPCRACGRKHIPSGIRLLAFHFQNLLAFQILQAFQWCFQ